MSKGAEPLKFWPWCDDYQGLAGSGLTGHATPPSKLRSYADDADQHGNRYVPISPATLRGLADALEATGTGLADPVAWMWQHDETGRTGFVDAWQLENGWQELNPRLRVVSPLYAAPMTAAPLTDERIDSIFYPTGQATADQLQVARACARAIELAHGIK